MALPQGINFRATSGYVSDGANETYEISGTANYPVTTPQGINVGWEQAPAATRDRNSGNDRRLAGLNRTDAGTADFRVDLPATGSHNIRCAFGDASYSAYCWATLLDTTSSLATLCNGGPTGAGNNFFDATGSIYSAAAWPGSNSSITKTFSTTILRVRVNPSSLGTFVDNCITHLYVESAGGGGGSSIVPIVMKQYRHRWGP